MAYTQETRHGPHIDLKGVVEIVPTFETAFARVRAYAVCECHKGLHYHHIV